MTIKEQEKLVKKLFNLRKKSTALANEEEKITTLLKEIIPTNSITKYNEFSVVHTLFEPCVIPEHTRREYSTLIIKKI